jgi:glycerol-3-phosphate acyltransferase PlsX
MSIAVDAMGGDFGPEVIVEGAVAASKEKNLEIILVGQEEIIQRELNRRHAKDLPIKIKQASQVVEMDESPADAIRKKKDSTIKVALELVKDRTVSAIVSAGNSGATLAAATIILGRIQGVRPAIATVMPTLKDPVVLIDVGANVDCKPHHLCQFGIMGSVFSKNILSNENPSVGLLSIGEEDYKGNIQVKKAYELLDKSGLNFIGNVEGRDVFKGNVNVIVCDGFVGNICLKLSEGLAESIIQMLKREIEGDVSAKLGYIFSRSAFKRFGKRIDYSEYGGAPLLGINGIVIISHGKSTPKAVKNAIIMANEFKLSNFIKQLDEALSSRKETISAQKVEKLNGV